MNAHGGVIQQQMGEAAPASLAQARSCVYFLRPVGERGPVKIGHSSNVEARMRQAATWAPFPLECVATHPGAQETERRFHVLFDAHHQHNEWFRAAPEIDAVIEAINAGTFDAKRLPAIPRDWPEPRGVTQNPVRGFIDGLGGTSTVAAKTGLKATHLTKWRCVNRIPRAAWPEILKAFPQVSLDRLLELEAAA